MWFDNVEQLEEHVDVCFARDTALSYNGTYAYDGEDGGCFIEALRELATLTMSHELGKFEYNGPHGGVDNKTLLIFETNKYKFLCVESREEVVYDGGTCAFGTVEFYLKEDSDEV
jgi:hypothetical protein|tara:strand:- start:901 stop:1245 length:345 start_codon:yes stop_codon:yes gene_type:complete